MPPLREWSFTRVLLVCVSWVGLVLVVVALWIFLRLRGGMGAGSGSGGIGAVSIGINALVLMIPVVPPVVLFVAWSIVRWRR